MRLDPSRSDKLTSALAAHVKKKIQDSTMSINQVAKIIGISRQTLHTKLAGRSEFTPSQLAALANLFGLKGSTLLRQAESEITATRQGSLKMTPKYVSPQQAAKLTSLSVWTIRRRIADGQIRNCRRSGNRILIPIDQLERIGRPMATAQSLRGSAA